MMPAPSCPPAAPAISAAPFAAKRDHEMHEINRAFYDPLWTASEIVPPERFNTWPLVQSLTENSARRLEVGPGLRPRLPLSKGTTFVDLSEVAVAKLRDTDADAVRGVISQLPFADNTFDLVCALDIVEHVEDDESALAELSRVAKPGAKLLISVPLHASRWQPFDTIVGHRRRYEPQTFFDQLHGHGFTIERSAEYGMQPKHPRLVEFGMRMLERHRQHAMWWYNRIFMPIGLFFQSKLVTREGIGDSAKADQIMLVCSKTARS